MEHHLRQKSCLVRGEVTKVDAPHFMARRRSAETKLQPHRTLLRLSNPQISSRKTFFSSRELRVLFSPFSPFFFPFFRLFSTSLHFLTLFNTFLHFFTLFYTFLHFFTTFPAFSRIFPHFPAFSRIFRTKN
jgi:hypothetical protein